MADPVSVGVIFVLAFALVAAGFWRRGSLLIGIGVGVAAVLRLVLSEDRAGLLVVRSEGHRLRHHDDGLRGDGLHRLDDRPPGHQLGSCSVARMHTVMYGSARPLELASAGWVASSSRTSSSVRVRTAAGEVMQ